MSFQCGVLRGRWFQLFLLISGSTCCLCSISTRSVITGQSSCETLPSTIHITKEVNDERGQLVRTCEGDIAVNKCEGTCQSQLQPSVVKSSGFLKECQCCRETHLREREVILQQCYDPEGQSVIGDLGHLVIRLKEPAMCKCFQCGGSEN